MMNWFAVNTGQVQDADHPLRRLELREHVRHHRGTLVRRVGARRPALGHEPRVLREALAAQVRRQLGKFKTPMLDHPQRPRFPLSRSARAMSCSPRCSGGRAVASSSTSPTRATGCSSRGTANTGTRRCSPGWRSMSPQEGSDRRPRWDPGNARVPPARRVPREHGALRTLTSYNSDSHWD